MRGTYMQLVLICMYMYMYVQYWYTLKPSNMYNHQTRQKSRQN